VKTKPGWARSPDYNSWVSLKQRCTNPRNPAYANYGGRGIRVCERWAASFDAFIADIGPRPTPKHQIDRIDNDGHYEPGNCRWATKIEQSLNRRTNHRVTAFGRTQCISEWAIEFGLSFNRLHTRLRSGLSPEQALTRPLQLGSKQKLSLEQVREIRCAPASTPTRALSRKYGVSLSAILRARRGETFRELTAAGAR
jgi:hypothetical protein